MKYILVTGAVLSQLGKGFMAASIGVLLKSTYGLRVTSIRLDPYKLRGDTDPYKLRGDTLASPFEHGEIFVVKDGGEVDMTIGIYERFLDVDLTSDHYISSEKIAKRFYDDEGAPKKEGIFKVEPHVREEIKKMIEAAAQKAVDDEGAPDICIIEMSSNVGDNESAPFLIALQQLSNSVGSNNFCVVDVTLIPMKGVPDLKDRHLKPSRFKVEELKALGLGPDFLVCLFPTLSPKDAKAKVSEFCQLQASQINIIEMEPNIWSIPQLLKDENADVSIRSRLQIALPLPAPPNILMEWTNMVKTYKNLKDSVHITLIVKYTGQTDSYVSVVHAILHACVACQLKPLIKWIASSDLEDDKTEDVRKAALAILKDTSCVVIPGGFGVYGVNGMLFAAKYARENKIPYLGIGLGMQVSVIEFTRSVLKCKYADSVEFDHQTLYPVIIGMPKASGKNMRLGSHKTTLRDKSLTAKLYNTLDVYERHRHQYEVNPNIIEHLERHGMVCAGRDASGKTMEVLELSQDEHPFYVGVQFHPEFQSRHGRPSPLFLGLIRAVREPKLS